MMIVDIMETYKKPLYSGYMRVFDNTLRNLRICYFSSPFIRTIDLKPLYRDFKQTSQETIKLN